MVTIVDRYGRVMEVVNGCEVDDYRRAADWVMNWRHVRKWERKLEHAKKRRRVRFLVLRKKPPADDRIFMAGRFSRN